MTTAEALQSITDRGLFELLGTSVLRNSSIDYNSVAHVGVNAAGEPIVSPVDAFGLVPHSAPPHYILIEHTTTDRSGLEAKWLFDHMLARPRVPKRKRELTDADDGDLLKAGRLAQIIRDSEPDANFTVVLSTNQPVDANLQRSVYGKARELHLGCDIWEQSRYADFLDNTPHGHWLRRNYLGIEAELISNSLLNELCGQSLRNYEKELFADPSTRTCRHTDAGISDRLYKRGCSILFLVGESGFGKSVSAYAALRSHLDSGGLGLWIPSQVVERAVTLAGAIDAVLRDLCPSIQCDAGRIVLQMGDRLPFLIVVDDINRARDVNATAQRLLSWSRPQSSDNGSEKQPLLHTVVCPIWPLAWAPLDQLIGKVTWAQSLSIGVMDSDEARSATILAVARAGVAITDYDADVLANRVGYDPMLIGLLGSIASECAPEDLNSACENVVERFVEIQISHVASRSSLVAQDLRQSLEFLAKTMLMNRELHPLWEDVRFWLSGNPVAEQSVRELARQGALCRIASDRRFVFRHDRIRDYSLIAGMVSLLNDTNGIPPVVTEPFFAEIVGEAIIRAPQHPDVLEFLRKDSPLALVEAIRGFGEARSDYERAIVNQVVYWAETAVETHNELDAVEGAVIWSLLETDSTAVLKISESFESYDLVSLARLRNGDALSGALFCVGKHGLVPATNDRLRDRIMEHALLRHGDGVKSQLTVLLQSESISDEVREGAIALAGFVGSPDLAESISIAWKLAGDNERLVPEALWAACRCHGPEFEKLFGPLLECWSQMPDDEGHKGGFTRKLDFAQQLGWALARKIDTDTIRYLIEQSSKISSLGWPITIVLEHIDHPDAIEFIARRAAEAIESVEGTGDLSPWVLCLPDKWDVSRGASRSLSSESLERLKALWQDPGNSEYLVRASFRLWSAGACKDDLDELRAILSDGVIYQQALWKRTVLGDPTVIPVLLPELTRDAHWFNVVHHVWCEALAEATQQHLASFRSNIPTDFTGGRLNCHYALSGLLTEIPAHDAEMLILQHWDHLRYSPLFVQAALYVGTQQCAAAVESAVDEWPEDIPVFEHLSSHFGFMTTGRRERLTMAHLDRLLPFMDRMPDFELARIAEACQRMGIPGWGQQHIASYLSEDSKKRYYPSDENLLSELDDLAGNASYGKWRTGFWLEGFEDRHDSRDRITQLLDRWLLANPTVRSLEIVSECIATVGMRSDLSVLTTHTVEGSQELIGRIVSDAQFRVFRRSLD
jgi:hypothetical protein